MTLDEALSVLTDIAARYAENIEDGLGRVHYGTTDEEIEAMLVNDPASSGLDDFDRDQLREVRSIWQAVELVNTLSQKVDWNRVAEEKA